MQFIDKSKISVKAGDGGNGKSSFRREKFVPKGGPDGGDGGKGGDVVLLVDENVNTLLNFRYNKKFIGKNGEHGETKNQYGKGAEDCVIKVPRGTLVKDAVTGEVLADLTLPAAEAGAVMPNLNLRRAELLPLLNSANRAKVAIYFWN